ncbi:C3 and PZP-like alpha-2-macroglobulin domain-containing protein 8 [Eublepharis macularius]|uniref:C3 and PZP-like alpha-2-macroglobulin domain-containing protein 8 n=1 Tax=Eublepharis macularius TaxID=481883 RepID=A0AA97JBS2_EUBMA|nr:C3 and PZP-like alpha-2-macroglobulin domain-containing protein 8 [Eublepharis macularius]
MTLPRSDITESDIIVQVQEHFMHALVTRRRDKNQYLPVLGKYDDYFVPKKNLIHEMACSHQRNQKTRGSAEAYVLVGRGEPPLPQFQRRSPSLPRWEPPRPRAVYLRRRRGLRGPSQEEASAAGAGGRPAASPAPERRLALAEAPGGAGRVPCGGRRPAPLPRACAPPPPPNKGGAGREPVRSSRRRRRRSAQAASRPEGGSEGAGLASRLRHGDKGAAPAMPGRRAWWLLLPTLGSLLAGSGGLRLGLGRGYLVVAPSVFRAGVEEAVSVTIFNPVKETTVQLQLTVKGEMVAWAHGTVLGKGTISLKVPPGLRGQAHLKVWGNRHLTEDGYIFHNHTTVTIDSKGASVFIQTDKPVYRPTQKVLINFFTVSPDLRPVDEKVEAYVLDPRGSRMIEWNNLKPICCGVLNVSFPLSDQPVSGEWFVFAEMQGHTYKKSFEVQKYVLPKFELWIEPPRYIRDLKTCEKGVVHARYTFGKPVTGRLTVNLTVNGVGYYRHEAGPPVFKTSKIDGSAHFEVCVGDLMPADIPEHFRGVVSIWATVTSADGNKQATFDDSTPVQKQLVDIQYTKDTRKQFKPGLPYRGKVEVTYPDGSPADRVTVRIKAELTPKDNIYTSELMSSRGLVVFEIPSIPAAAQYAWLEAKVTAIDGKPVGDQYLPNYLSISSWYSPSKCYLQLQMLDRPFLVGEEASIAVKSTCPCNFTLHYEVVSRGNIVLSGLQSRNVTQQRSRSAAASSGRSSHVAPFPATTSPPAVEMSICVTSLRFLVTHSMAPLGRLLVYYVQEDGEGVTDSLQFAVKPSFENQVSVMFLANETRPGDYVGIKVRAAKGSCVCLATVDKSVYLLKPGFQLMSSQIFQELADYDVSDTFGTIKEDGHFWWPGMALHGRRRRSSIFPWHWDTTKDARFAFTETGLVVMTDLVSLNHRQHGSMYTDEAVPAFQPHTGTLVASMQHSKAVPRAEKKKRVFFPETWLWHCLNVSHVSGEAQLQVEVPDSITTWLTEAVGMSEDSGMGLARQASLTTFKAFFIEFTLPYRVIRGEQTKIPLTVHNYLAVCMEVHIKVVVPKGIKFVGHPGKHHLTRRKCVTPGEAKATSVVLSFSKLGLNNITAKAFAYGGSGCCQDKLQFAKSGKNPEDFYLDRQAPVGVDYIRRSILVEPEGLTREYTYSVFFCPNEKIHISTPNKYEYQYVQKPSHMTHFTVAVKAHNSAHIALSSSPHDTAEMTEIVIGGHQNTRTWISSSKMGEPVASAETAGLLSWDEFRSFWIRWANGVIQVGHGHSILNESVIVSWVPPQPPEVRYIGFSTGWGSVGEFKIWRKEEVDENHNEAFTLGVPHNVIPGSEKATASVIGDVMGPTLKNLDNLLQLPLGCGEQNMIHFAPNVFVLKYLQKTKQLTPEVESEATDYLIQGYQRQLTYKRQDGSYSAFGERDSSGSMWLTAFVLKSFAQSRGFIFIDPKELLAAKDWIIRHQKEEGSFPAVGRILNKDLQGGIHGKISLTAYVVAALLESGVTCEEEKASVAKAKLFLESNIYSVEDPYTTVLTAYALTLLRSPSAGVALRKMNSLAITQDGITHWSLTGTLAADEDTFMGFSDGLFQSVVSAEVEMTAYALLTYTVLGDVASALPVVKWLSQQRNALGGFSSTQDTCVALQALAEYAILSYTGGVNLTISLASTNLDYQETFELNKANKKLLQSTVIPTIPTGLFVSAKGEGCCLLQIDVAYNVPDPLAKPAFQLLVNLQEPKLKRHRRAPHPPKPVSPDKNRFEASPWELGGDDDPASDQDHREYRVAVEACMRWLHSGSSNMAVLEVPLLSGFQADVESLEQLFMNKQIGLKRYEVDGRKVLFYFDEIPSQCMTCVKFTAFREYIVGKTAPVPIKVYDYYEPALEATRFYNVSENSPLARELCDGALCNEVESAASRWVGFTPAGPCNHILGCLEDGYFDQCRCSRDCGYDGDLVCGSDGHVYQNRCQMEVAACRNSTRIQQISMTQCTGVKNTPERREKHFHPPERPAQRQQMLTDEGPTLQLDFSYYSYEYEADPYTSEGDAFEQTTTAQVRNGSVGLL